jgi:hypothetical protein
MMNSMPPGPIPPPSRVQSTPPQPGIFIVLRVPGLSFVGTGAEIIEAMLLKILSDPLREKGLLCEQQPCEENGFVARYRAVVVADAVTFDKIFGLFTVNHLNHALAAVKESLASIDALPHSKIGYMGRDRVWRGLWPHETQEPFEKSFALFTESHAKLKAQDRPKQDPQ